MGSVSRELCLFFVWSDSMKYRASLPHFFLTVYLVGSVSRELCLKSVWSERMKYRASLSPFFLTVWLGDSAPPELCLNSVLSESMKYRAPLSRIVSDTLPCGFHVSGTLPKFGVVPRHEMQGVTLANCLLPFALWAQCLGNSA